MPPARPSGKGSDQVAGAGNDRIANVHRAASEFPPSSEPTVSHMLAPITDDDISFPSSSRRAPYWKSNDASGQDAGFVERISIGFGFRQNLQIEASDRTGRCVLRGGRRLDVLRLQSSLRWTDSSRTWELPRLTTLRRVPTFTAAQAGGDSWQKGGTGNDFHAWKPRTELTPSSRLQNICSCCWSWS